MTRFFINSVLLSKLGECNIYYINHKYILLYLGLENTTLNKQNFVSNKKIYTLIFWRGNKGNKGNRANKVLKLQQSFVPHFSVFCSPCSPYSFWLDKLSALFLKDFFEKPKYYHNAYFLCSFTLISDIFNKLRQYHRNDVSKLLIPSCIKPPDILFFLSRIFMFFVCERKFL